jgi:hypothetical protein
LPVQSEVRAPYHSKVKNVISSGNITENANGKQKAEH